MGINYTKDPFIMCMFYTRSVIQNGSIFKSQTHTSGHFDIGVAPRPPGKTGCKSRVGCHGKKNVNCDLLQRDVEVADYKIKY